ncbi:MAG: hemerythrin domain-containing protein [Sulfurovum sp.]
MIISTYMKNEHRECDTLFAQAEQAVASNDWSSAKSAFESFRDDTLLHFQKEENELFVKFEEATGMSEGPTQVMRYEHEQVRGLLSKLEDALSNSDRDSYLSIAEAMMILLQQHNMKEEQMLYAMCDRVLPVETKEDIIETMKSLSL